MDNDKRSGWTWLLLAAAGIALFCDFAWIAGVLLGEDAKFGVLIVSFFASPVLIPVFILVVVGVLSPFFLNDSRRGLLCILSGSALGLFILACILLGGSSVDARKLEKNYLMHSDDMQLAIDYALDCLEDGQGVDIEFNERGRVNIFSIVHNRMWNTLWDPTRAQVDSLCAVLGLGSEELYGIRERLKDAHCHSIKLIRQDGTYDVATMMFRRDMGSAYYYDIHRIAMTEEEMADVNENDCERIAFDPQVCFVYGSPAWGNVCFPGKDTYLAGWRRLSSAERGESSPEFSAAPTGEN